MELDKQQELLIAVALSRFSVDFESSHPNVAKRAEKLSIKLLDHHDVIPYEVTISVLDC